MDIWGLETLEARYLADSLGSLYEISFVIKGITLIKSVLENIDEYCLISQEVSKYSRKVPNEVIGNLAKKSTHKTDGCHLQTEAATGGVLKEKVLSEMSQNSHENTFARVSFLIKLQADNCNFLKKRESGTGVFL